MDLLSLPQELLASVLKYVPVENLTSVRKVSSDIDLIAKKYHLEHKEFNKIQIYKGVASTVVVLQYGDNLEFVREHGNESILQILKCYLPKMRRLLVIWLISSEQTNHFVITKEIVKLFMKYRKLKTFSLLFYRCELQFDVTLLNRLLKTLAIKYFYLKSYVKEEEYFHYTDKLLDGLQFSSLTLLPMSSTFPSRISLKAVKQLCEENFPKQLTLYGLKIYISKLGRFLEQNLDAWAEMIKRWEFGVEPGNMEAADVEQYIMNLKCLENYEIRTSFPSVFSITKSNSFADLPFLYIVIE